MRSFSILFFCVLFCQTSQAQSANTLMFGANVLTSSVNSFNERPVYEQSLQARIGYFATNHLAIGLCLEAGIGGNKTVPYGLTLFSRWYSGHKSYQPVKFFVEVGAGIADNKYTAGETSMIPAKNWMRTTAYISPGISVCPAPWLALELAPEYRHITGNYALNRLGISAGIKIFLSEQIFKKTFPNEFKSLY